MSSPRSHIPSGLALVCVLLRLHPCFVPNPCPTHSLGQVPNLGFSLAFLCDVRVLAGTPAADCDYGFGAQPNYWTQRRDERASRYTELEEVFTRYDVMLLPSIV